MNVHRMQASTFEGDPDWATALDEAEHLLIRLARPRRLFAPVAEETRIALRQLKDTNRLVELSIQHAVFPLVYRNLKSLSNGDENEGLIEATAMQRLRSFSHSSNRNGLLLSHALFDLQKKLSDIKIEVAVHKGVVVASQYYGEISDRVFGDLDLFVRRDDVRKAAHLLVSLGLRAVDPVPEVIEDLWLSYRPWQNPHGNAVGFTKPVGHGGPLDVDLQWGLAPHYFTLDLNPAPFWERIRSVQLLGHSVTTFSTEDTFLLLCLHGAKHTWTELRQVVDIAAFLSATPDLDWDVVMKEAEQANCTRIVLLAARLGAALQDAPLPPQIQSAAGSARVSDLFRRVIAWRFAERRSRIGRLSQSVAFHVRARDRRRDCVGTVIHDVQVALRKTGALG